MRLAVYTDYTYHVETASPTRSGRSPYSSPDLRRISLGLTVFGRLDPAPARSRYGLGADVDFVALPYYRTLG